MIPGKQSNVQRRNQSCALSLNAFLSAQCWETTGLLEPRDGACVPSNSPLHSPIWGAIILSCEGGGHWTGLCWSLRDCRLGCLHIPITSMYLHSPAPSWHTAVRKGHHHPLSWQSQPPHLPLCLPPVTSSLSTSSYRL
jgi:hypothetical protein